MSFWSLFFLESFSQSYRTHLAGSVSHKDIVNTTATTPNVLNDESGNPMNNCEKTAGDQPNIGTDNISGIDGNKFSDISGMCCPQNIQDLPKKVLNIKAVKYVNICIDFPYINYSSIKFIVKIEGIFLVPFRYCEDKNLDIFDCLCSCLLYILICLIFVNGF